MTWSPKDPHSSELFDLDFTLLLAPDDSVASVIGVTIDVGAAPADETLVMGTPAINGNRVVFRLTGGNPGLTYEIRAEVDTAAGDRLELTGTLLIRTQR